MRRFFVAIVGALVVASCSSDHSIDNIVGPSSHKITPPLTDPTQPVDGPVTGPNDLAYQVTLTGGPAGYGCPGARYIQQAPENSKDFRYTVSITRVGPVDFEVLAFGHHRNDSGPCVKTTDNIFPLEINGQTIFHAGGPSGVFVVDLERFTCGEVQVDFMAVNLVTRAKIAGFVEEVQDSRENCHPPIDPPTDPPTPPITPPIVPPIPPVIPPVVPPIPPVIPPIEPPIVPPMPNCVYGTNGGVVDVLISPDGSTYSFRVLDGYKDVPLQLVSWSGHEGHIPPDRPQRVVSFKHQIFQPGTYSWSITPDCQTDLYCTATPTYVGKILQPDEYFPQDGFYIDGHALTCPVQ